MSKHDLLRAVPLAIAVLALLLVVINEIWWR